MADASKFESPGSSDAQAPAESATPLDLKVQLKEQRLVVQWKDGTVSTFPFALLRGQCPCATCRTERDKRESNPLQVLKFNPAELRVTGARLVGRYAIQFEWSDGHNTGIFDFRLLRSLGEQAKG